MMRPREKEFCLLTAVLGDPEEAARRAGWKQPENAWPGLISREDIAGEISRTAKNVGGVYRDILPCAVFRLLTADNSDAVRLLNREAVTDEELRRADLSGVAEMKKTDKGVEIKFFDRIKALDKLYEIGGADGEGGSSGGLIEAMMLSAQALRGAPVREDEEDEV